MQLAFSPEDEKKFRRYIGLAIILSIIYVILAIYLNFFTVYKFSLLDNSYMLLLWIVILLTVYREKLMTFETQHKRAYFLIYFFGISITMLVFLLIFDLSVK